MQMASIQEEHYLLNVAPDKDEKGTKAGVPNKHGLTLLTTATFLMGEMAGSGVLALPAALNGTGYTGVLLIVVCALASAYTGMLLGECWQMVMHRYEEYKENTRHPYPAIGYVIFGKPGRLLVSCSINISMFGASVVFLLLASENIQSLMKSSGTQISFCYWLLIVAGVLWPVSWLGTPKDFWPMGIGAMLATFSACFIIVANAISDGLTMPRGYHKSASFRTFFTSLGTMSFSFGGHPTFPTIQTDMKKPEQFGVAVFFACIVLVVMYLPVAVTGYYVYGSSLYDNVLLSLSPGPMRVAVLVLITLHLLCAFVIIINPTAQELEELLNIPKHFGVKRVLFRTLFVCVALFVAETVPNFGPILALLGGSTLTLLAFILPPIFYLKLCSMEGNWETTPVPLHTKMLCIEIICVGTLVGIIATYSAFAELLTSSFSTPCYINTAAAEPG